MTHEEVYTKIKASLHRAYLMAEAGDLAKAHAVIANTPGITMNDIQANLPAHTIKALRKHQRTLKRGK